MSQYCEVMPHKLPRTAIFFGVSFPVMIKLFSRYSSWDSHLARSYLLILMVQPLRRQGLLNFHQPFYQEKCRRGGQAAPGCLCGIASLDTGQPFQECPPCYGEIGFVCAGILTKKSSLKGSIANLQEFQPKNCYNASGAVRGASQPGGLRGEPVAHPQSPRRPRGRPKGKRNNTIKN